jgi:hypothetical protein
MADESKDDTRQRRIAELGTLLAQYVPDEFLTGSESRFEQAWAAIEYSTLSEVVRDAIAYGEIDEK